MSVGFVDTHVHLIDQRHPRLRFSWQEPGFIHPLLGEIDPVKHLAYGPEAFEAESRFAGVTKFVNVQSATDTPDPVEETIWLQRLAEETGWPTAIVAHVDLAAEDAEAQLERHRASPGLRGIRDFGQGDYLVDPAWRRGAALLPGRDLILDLDCRWEQMAEAQDLAEAIPDLTIVLEHAGYPLERTDEYLRAWRDGISTLSRSPNVMCKISGLGMGDPRWTLESLRPMVEYVLEAFGVERCFFGSNWPVDRLYSSYDAVVGAYRELVSTFSADEQERLLAGNAERTYRI